MNKPIFIVMLAFMFLLTVNARAQKIYRYGELPKNAGEPSSFQNFKPLNSTNMGFNFRFEKHTNIPLLKKATRILAKEIVEKLVATETIAPEKMWEERLKTLMALDREAEEYLTKPVPASETVQIENSDLNQSASAELKALNPENEVQSPEP